jgi:hypothetical protein
MAGRNLGGWDRSVLSYSGYVFDLNRCVRYQGFQEIDEGKEKN